jgi:threonine dehydrogenase-like Zn-dependent dehydrogenase
MEPEMRALRFHYSLPRIAASKILGTVFPRAFVGPLAPLRYEEVGELALPADDWVKVRTRLAGICGSDLKEVMLKGAWDNPLTALISFPHVLGHEVVGTIESVGDKVKNLRPGQRVLIDPWLSCRTRGFDVPCVACKAGDYTLCRNFTRGSLPAGIHLGNNAGAPGAFARGLVAHATQCIPIPDAVSDEAAVLGDPFAVSLHSVLRAPPPPDAPALVWGLGTLGLMAVAVLRRLYPDVIVYAIGKHPQQVALAKKLGAHQVLELSGNRIVERIAELTGAQMLRPWSKSPWLLDGVGVLYDTIGSPQTVELGMRITRTRGTIVISGVEVPRRFEWTPLYFKEVAIIGSNAFAMETIDGKRVHAMQAYLDMCQAGLDVTSIITHRFPLDEWKRAFHALLTKRRSGAVKIVLTNTAAS